MYAGRVVERGRDARPLLRPAASVHVGPARLDPAPRPAEAGAAALDQGRAAVADQRAAGLQVPAALPARVREVHARSRRSRTASRSRAISTAAGSTSSTSGAHRDATISGERRRPREHERRAQPLVEVKHVKKYFPIRKGVLQREVARVHAVDDVSFAVQAGRDARPRRRVGLRQVDARPDDRPPARADGRRDPLRGAADRGARRRGSCARCAGRCRWSSRIRTRA